MFIVYSERTMMSFEPYGTVCYDGGGWTIPYLLGVTEALQEDGLSESLAFTGVSSGSCVALAAALGVPMAQLMAECLAWSHLCRACPVLTVTAVRSICRGRLEAVEAVEAVEAGRVQERLEGRFAVGVKPYHKNELLIVSAFEDLETVAATVAGSCTVPYVNTLPPLLSAREKELGYLDGVLSAHFFTPPWAGKESIIVNVSAVQGRVGATIACPERLPFTSGVVPMSENRLVDLWHLGVSDGPKLRAALLPKCKQPCHQRPPPSPSPRSLRFR